MRILIFIILLIPLIAMAQQDVSRLPSGKEVGNRGSIATMPFISNANDAAGAAYLFDTVYTRASGNLFELYNGGVLKFSINYAGTASGVVAPTTLNVPHSITLPATCAVGDAYMDTDATSGQRWYLCEATNTWIAQGAVTPPTGTGFAHVTSGAYDAASSTATITGGTCTNQFIKALTTAGVETCASINFATDGTGVTPVANGGTNASVAGITAFNNITGYTASGATGTTSTNLVFSTSPTLVTPALGEAGATGLVITDASSAGLEVGPNGATNPVFRVIDNVASQAAGVSLAGNASGSGVTWTMLGGTNESMNLAPKGTGGLKVTGNAHDATGVLFWAAPNSGASFTKIFDNGTMIIDADSGTGTTPFDIRYSGNEIFSVNYLGTLTMGSAATANPSITFQGISGRNIKIYKNKIDFNADNFITSRAAATLQFGDVDAASPVAQTIGFQGARAGTDTNTAGVTPTINPSLGTGTGAIAPLVIDYPIAAVSGTGQHTVAAAMTFGNPMTAAVPISVTATNSNAIGVLVSGHNFDGFGRNGTVGGANFYGESQATPSDTNADVLLTSAGFRMSSTECFGWSSSNVTQNTDAQFCRGGAGIIQQGAADAATAVAQTSGVQNIVAGTSNVAGAARIIRGSLGTGNATPATLEIQTAQKAGSGTAQQVATARMRVNAGGNIEFSGIAPAVTSCGTGSPTAVGNSNVMAVTVGGGAVTSCTVTFDTTNSATPFTNAPICIADDASNVLAVKASATTTVLTLTSLTSMAADVVNVHCIGYY